MLDDRGRDRVVDHLGDVGGRQQVVALRRSGQVDAVEEGRDAGEVVVVGVLLLEPVLDQRPGRVERAVAGLEELVVGVALAVAPGPVEDVDVGVQALERARCAGS